MYHFRSSLFVTVIGLSLALYMGGIHALYIVALLAILEISLSFDNAVVNAKVLESMEVKWQQRFITFGIPVAVFGMRFLFPIIIVAIASGSGIFNTFDMALNNPELYHATLVKSEHYIFAFGGSFLLMVFLDFLFKVDREEKWIEIIEDSEVVHKMGKFPLIQIVISIVIGFLLVFFTEEYELIIPYTIGFILHYGIDKLDDLFNTNGVRNGIMGFIYLEVLDASFSFDGVIGAFALSSDIFIIMLGLGIGAMFVRSLTLYMLEQKTLTEYRYLEHGAHYAILLLSFIMLAKTFIDINEVVVGTVGITLIALSFYYSIRENRKRVHV